MSATDAATVAAVLEDLLDAHNGVNSTAGWEGSPNPQDWRNIRRVCKCGAVIGGHDRSHEKPGRAYPMSGYPFDPPHMAHVAAALLAAAPIAQALAAVEAVARVEALADEYARNGAAREAAGKPAWPNNVARDLRAALRPVVDGA